MSRPSVPGDGSPVAETPHIRGHLQLGDRHKPVLGRCGGSAWAGTALRLSAVQPERLALVIAHCEGAVTPRRLRGLYPDTDASGPLSGAVAKGLLLRVGERGGTRYQLSGEIVRLAGSGTHSMACGSVAVPTVERVSDPIRS